MTQTRLGGSRLTMVGALTESKCAECGKSYMHTTEHVYYPCCTYKCMRAREAKEQKRKKGYCLGIPELLRRIERCEERIEHHTKIIETVAPGTKARSNSIRMLREWKDKLEDYEIQLEEANDA